MIATQSSLLALHKNYQSNVLRIENCTPVCLSVDLHLKMFLSVLCVCVCVCVCVCDRNQVIHLGMNHVQDRVTEREAREGEREREREGARKRKRKREERHAL